MAEDGQDDDAPSSQELQADDDDDCRRQELEAAMSPNSPRRSLDGYGRGEGATAGLTPHVLQVVLHTDIRYVDLASIDARKVCVVLGYGRRVVDLQPKLHVPGQQHCC